eukprot:11181303-Lingulodinium_polyedra.AAC.1
MHQEAEHDRMVAASSSSQAGSIPPGAQTFRMNSDGGNDMPASDRDEPPPPRLTTVQPLRRRI